MNGRSSARLGDGILAAVLDLLIPRDCCAEQLYCPLLCSVSSASLTGLTLFGLDIAESGKEPGICCTLCGTLLGVDVLIDERVDWVRTIMGVVDLEPPEPRYVPCGISPFMPSRKYGAVTRVDSDASQAWSESRVGDWADSTMLSLMDRKMTSTAS